MAQYRKKPVVIEAMQWDGSPLVVFWVNGNGGSTDSGASADDLVVATLEGDMTVRRGDWIIRGVAGEFYPCRPEVFAATYEETQRATDPGAHPTRPLRSHVDALSDVATEVSRVTARHGEQNPSDFEWVSVLTEEVGEAAKEANEANSSIGKNRGNYELLYEELTQVAAVAVLWMEALGRRVSCDVCGTATTLSEATPLLDGDVPDGLLCRSCGGGR